MIESPGRPIREPYGGVYYIPLVRDYMNLATGHRPFGFWSISHWSIANYPLSYSFLYDWVPVRGPCNIYTVRKGWLFYCCFLYHCYLYVWFPLNIVPATFISIVPVPVRYIVPIILYWRNTAKMVNDFAAGARNSLTFFYNEWSQFLYTSHRECYVVLSKLIHGNKNISPFGISSWAASLLMLIFSRRELNAVWRSSTVSNRRSRVSKLLCVSRNNPFVREALLVLLYCI